MARCVLFPHYLIYKEQIKCRVHFKCAICIWNLLLSTLNMRSKELSLSVKQAIIRLKNQNKPIREIAKTLDVAKSTVWNILKKEECTGELSNTKRSGRPRKTTVVHDRRIISLVKKNPVRPGFNIKYNIRTLFVEQKKFCGVSVHTWPATSPGRTLQTNDYARCAGPVTSGDDIRSAEYIFWMIKERMSFWLFYIMSGEMVGIVCRGCMSVISGQLALSRGYLLFN